jgi:hypothetical protein
VRPRGEERLAGYAVYTVDGGKALLRDLFAEDLEATAEALLCALADHLRRARVDSAALCFVGSPDFRARLRRLGFHLRPGTRSLVLHPEHLSDSLRAQVTDPSRWFMLDGELDI